MPPYPTLDFVIAFWIMIYVSHIVNFAILYSYVDLSDNYVDLSDNYVGLSDNYVDLSENYVIKWAWIHFND
jgi:hypothetical protein